MQDLSEDEQLQAAMRASMEDVTPTDGEDDDEVEYLGSKEDMQMNEDSKPPAAAAPPPPSVMEQLLSVSVPDEPAAGARMQIRLPDGKRVVRRFSPSDPVKILYAFLAVRSNGGVARRPSSCG
jgi:hypothetical protein